MRSASVACLVLSLCVACTTPRVDLTPRWVDFDVSGDVGMASGPVTAEVDLATAGLQADDSVLGARFDFDWSGLHLMASGQQSTHDGDGTLSADISAGGVTIPAGADVASSLDFGLWTSALTFDLIPTELAELGLGLGLSYLDLDAAFEEDVTGTLVETDEAAPIPTLCVRVGSRFWRLDVSVQGSGIGYSYDGTEISLLDIDAMAKLRLIGSGDHLTGSLSAGYRWVDLGLDYEDGSDQVEADVTFEGPWLGFTVSI